MRSGRGAGRIGGVITTALAAAGGALTTPSPLVALALFAGALAAGLAALAPLAPEDAALAADALLPGNPADPLLPAVLAPDPPPGLAQAASASRAASPSQRVVPAQRERRCARRGCLASQTMQSEQARVASSGWR
jgi:hypothetical protein